MRAREAGSGGSAETREALDALARLLERVWVRGARRLPGGVPAHRIVFSPRLTTTWAVIYYRRREVRLSPYVFLLPESRLHHGSYFRELEATVLHELAHAHLWAETGDVGHPPGFASRLRALGIAPNGAADLGPENVAFRYRYGCSSCGRTVLRRLPFQRTRSCARCHPQGFNAAFALRLVERLPSPAVRLRAEAERIRDAVEEGRARYSNRRVIAPRARAPKGVARGAR